MLAFNKPFVANGAARVLRLWYRGKLFRTYAHDGKPVKIYKVPELFRPTVQGFTMGDNVFILDKEYAPGLELAKLLHHEYVHVDQYRRMGFWGVRFLIVYSFYHLKYGYTDNPLEIEARVAEHRDVS